MRILVVHPAPGFSVADVYIGWVEAFQELGQQIVQYNLDARLTAYESSLIEVGKHENNIIELRKLYTREQAIQLSTNGILSACFQFWPHVLFIVSGFFLDGQMLDVIRSRGIKVVILHTEEPYEHERELKLGRHADLNLLNDPTNLEEFRALGPAEYIPHSYRPTVHHPGPPDPNLAADFGFVGTGFPSRIQFFEGMNFDGLDVLLAGNWQGLAADSPLRKHLAHEDEECLDNEQTAEIYRSAKVGLNFYRREAESAGGVDGWACGPREIEMAACGMPFLRDPRPEGDELFGMLPKFTSPQDATDKLRWWLKHSDSRWRAADKARAAIADRTFTNSAKRLLNLLDK